MEMVPSVLSSFSATASSPANADQRVLRSTVTVPERLLLIGLPLTILLGFAVAWLFFPGLGVLELGLLATMLAPTDAALGKPVVVNPAVPANIRESLNVESGLNDGLCVPEPLRGAESLGEALSLMTWLVFGSIVVSQLLGHASLAIIPYALSLTVLRMLPVALCLLGARVTIAESLFVGWFGPRGLASIVFAIMVFDAELPGNTTLMATVAWTVVLSVVAHGLTANSFARLLATRTTLIGVDDPSTRPAARSPP
jgi:NhaP-type Na+/H+ or K+/H+ antiporter